MLVVAIIALLSAVVMPKFGNLVAKARESRAKVGLASFRSAISIYYADTEGVHPQERDALVPRYIEEIPAILVPAPGNHPTSDEVGDVLDDWATNRAWLYNSGTGDVRVNCTHPDTRGNIWTSY